MVNFFQIKTRIVYDFVFRHPFFSAHRRMMMYLIFGSFAALVDVVIYVILVNFGHVTPLIANTASVFIATLVGFLFNAILNFRINDYVWIRFISYACVSVIGYGFSSLMIYTFHNILAFDANIVKILSLPCIFVIQYMLNKMFSFRKDHLKNIFATKTLV